jgi:hypothetical protein
LNAGHLPQALVPPEVRVVDRAVPGLEPAEPLERAFQQDEVDRGNQDADREQARHFQLRKPAVRVEGSQGEHGDQEQMQPPAGQEDGHGPEVVPVLRAQPGPQLVAGPQIVERQVALYRPRDLE